MRPRFSEYATYGTSCAREQGPKGRVYEQRGISTAYAPVMPDQGYGEHSIDAKLHRPLITCVGYLTHLSLVVHISGFTR